MDDFGSMQKIDEDNKESNQTQIDKVDQKNKSSNKQNEGPSNNIMKTPMTQLDLEFDAVSSDKSDGMSKDFDG